MHVESGLGGFSSQSMVPEAFKESFDVVPWFEHIHKGVPAPRSLSAYLCMTRGFCTLVECEPLRDQDGELDVDGCERISLGVHLRRLANQFPVVVFSRSGAGAPWNANVSLPNRNSQP